MQNKNFFTKTRWLVTIILLLTLSVTQMWAVKVLDFDFSDKDASVLSGWPTSSSAEANTKTYTLTNSYTFSLATDVYLGSYNSVEYLMVKKGAYLGLPAIANYKLTGVTISNSSECSTSVKVAVCTSSAGSTAVSGGSAKTFSTKGSTYTYTLSSTSANTVYYLYVTSANCQIIDITLTYTATSKFKVTFNAGNGTCGSASLTESSIGSGVTLPSASPIASCSSDYTFMGWATAAVEDEDEEPEMYFAGNVFYPESDCTLYAVYVTGKTATNSYRLISNKAQLQSGENYVIEAYTGGSDYAIKAAIKSSNYIDYKDISDEFSGTIYSEDTPDNNIVWTITKSNETTVSLYNSANSKYLYINTSSPYYLQLNASSKTFTLENEDHGESYSNTFAFKSSNKYIYYDASSEYFSSQASSNKNLYVYKRIYSGTFNTSPVCASCGSDPTVTAASLNGSITSTQIPVQCASGISNIGGAGCSLTSYGFVWAPSATTTTPTLDNSNHEVGTSIAASTAFNYTITGLTPNTEYAIRPYATNGHGTAYGSAYTVTTLQRYAISYNNNGGSNSMDGAYKDHGVAFALPSTAGSMTKTGYHATGWLLGSSSGTHYDLSGSYTTNAAATFYVEWTANTYQVAFDKNGGTGSMSNETGFTYGESKALTACSFTAPAHKYFIGWNTDKDATTALYTDGQSVSNLTTTHNGTVTLYAIWKDHTFTNYRTVCCTEMGTINNSLTLTQGGNSVTISGWTYNDASSTKPAESNLASYTVRMYKKNGASWDLVSGTASGGSAGTAGTRTGIATNSKSVTFTGLVVESEYKFTIEGIGAAGYCDIEETEITSINSTDVSSTPFKFRYSIYIDNGSNSGWAHHYIEPTGNTDEGSVDITLSGPVDYYQFKIAGGYSGWWGQTGDSKYTTGGSEWTLNGSNNVKMQTWIGGTYTFTVDYSGTTNPKVTITYPSANQDAGNIVYWDASVVANWDHLYFRVGTDANANASSDCKVNAQKVPGTDNFYKVTTASFSGLSAWAITNNCGWTGSNTNGVYKTNTDDSYAITLSSEYQDYAVDATGVTLVPYGAGTMGTYSHDNNCRFYTVTKTDGMLTHNVSLNSPAHGTLLVTYTNTSGTAGQTVTEGNDADLAHRCILTITATPDNGYTCSSLTVNGSDFTSGNTHILSADAEVEATFVAQTSTVTLDNNDATSGSQQTVTATYDAAMPLVTTAVGTPAVAAISRTGYTFNGWWDATSGGNQYYTYNSGTGAIASARMWDKTGAQTLKAQWTVNQYTLTWDLQGGTVTTAGTGAAAAATGTPSSSQDYGTALTAPVVTKTGYNFNVWSPSVAGTMPAENTTYTATWTAQVYDITYKDQGDNAYSGNVTAGVPTGAPTTHTYGSATALVNGVKAGYRFDGWFTDASCTVSAGSSIGATAVTADFTLYAKWTAVYTVTWSVNGDTWATGVVDGNTYVPSGSKVSALPTAPTSSDCDDAKVFVGWRATAIVGTSAGNPGSIFTTRAASPAITANTTFYAVFADVSGGNSLTLTFPDDNSENNGLSNYTSTWTAKAGTFEFSIVNFNNNNWGGSWTFIKCGRKDYASVASITTGSDIDFRVDSVLIAISSITASQVNSAKLQISSASDFGTTTDMDIPQSSGIQRLKIASPATDKYYRIKFDCQANSNGFIQVNSVVFKQNLDTANYVTSCASCDADATYTNTTPTVSDIDCTGATLTMEDGLATVGADGCHISDYGFVIGTADNPAIGGVGVTKYQVGTSDPTTGTDFSYDATGLTKGTHYYIRAYATNRHGTAYSSSTNFWTKNVSSIAITTAPTKTNYLVGETFNATGMVVTATMADDSEEDVTEDVTYSSSALTAGANQDFAINYSLCETDKSVNQKINVYTLTVVEGTNPSYGVASGSVNIVSITGLGEHKTYSLTVTSSNATAVDNGDNTWTITNPTGNVTVTVNYRDAEQVKVYYKVDGVTVTGLTQDVYESETTTLPTASQLATAMTAQSMDIPDDDYPNFWGWSETEFPAQAAEPTIVTGTPTISAEKIYYAVYTNMTKKQILPSNFSGTYSVNDGAQTYDGVGYYISNICLYSSKIQFRNYPGYLYSTSALQYIKKIEITGLDLVVNACSDNAGTLDGDAITPTGTAPYVYTFPASKQYFKIKGKGGTDKVSLIEIFYANATVYYMTQFCATKITLTQNNPSNGTVAFSRSSLATCGSDKNVSLTITPALGYQLTGWTVNTTSGYADAKTTSPAVVTNNNNSTVQNITLTFAQDANKDYDVTATFGLMTVSSWTWTHNSAAIPDPLNLYVGQSARLDVAYTPAGVDASKKTYTRNKDDAYINWVGAQQATYSTISGKASTGENTTAVTFTHADGPSTTVNVKVLSLPSVHFVDNVHNESFSDVVATLSDNALSPTKTTPTHADYDGSTLNTCEEQHLHLVGWIREDWPALVTYMNGGAQPNTAAITGAGNDGSGNAYFFAPGVSINTLTFNGVTFYAVWAKVE